MIMCTQDPATKKYVVDIIRARKIWETKWSYSPKLKEYGLITLGAIYSIRPRFNEYRKWLLIPCV